MKPSDRWRAALLLQLVCAAGASPRPAARRVATALGVVRGRWAPRPAHYAYRGVPYARPPTLHGRFKAPEPPPPWSGTFEAVHRVRCPQPDGSGDENCLVVNVFAPEPPASRPVLVHFHGGRFREGWGLHHGPRRLLEQGFVFVTFNYRLGALGFLCLGAPDAPGNAGLKDQVAALYWVNRNIEKFGGNPADVTAYGTGSGAASIELLMFSGMIRNFIHKVILESGTALSPSAILYEPVLNAFNFARKLGYKHDSELGTLLEYYYTVPYEKLANTTEHFVPCIEREHTNGLLDKDPRKYLQNAKYMNVQMMIIYTNAEEVSIVPDNIDRFNDIPDNFEKILPSNIIFDNDTTRNKVASVVKDYYFNELGLTSGIVQGYVGYINDIFMEYPVVKSAVYHANNQNVVFLMKFLYKGRRNADKHGTVPGATFGDVFTYIIANNELEEFDEIVAERLITMWSNFIKLGDPTPLTSLLIPEVWQPLMPYVVDSKIVLRNIHCLMFEQSMTNRILAGQQFVFWDYIYDKFYINTFDQDN